MRLIVVKMTLQTVLSFTMEAYHMKDGTYNAMLAI